MPAIAGLLHKYVAGVGVPQLSDGSLLLELHMGAANELLFKKQTGTRRERGGLR